MSEPDALGVGQEGYNPLTMQARAYSTITPRTVSLQNGSGHSPAFVRLHLELLIRLHKA